MLQNRRQNESRQAYAKELGGLLLPSEGTWAAKIMRESNLGVAEQ